ncbi:MAG: amino acid--[acyl-carrier-protein] ligase [Polyangiales bacterium]
MAPPKATNPVEKEFLDQLIAAKLLIPCDVPGVYGRGGEFEDVIERVNDLITREAKGDGAEVQRYPPIISRKSYETSEHLKSFPDLAGIVHSFRGKDADHKVVLEKLEKGEDWSKDFPVTDVVLTPATCYPIYPASRGTLGDNGRLVDIYSYCFRHEPSGDPARMQAFRQREYVRVGTPDQVREFRNVWFERGQQILAKLGVDAKPVVANDPFFGRGGKMLAMNQRDQELKFELVIPVCSTENPTACVSLNYHQDHFGHIFGIKTPDGADAHTSCIGFGMERIALAMFKKLGLSTREWPTAVRAQLWPS